MTDLTRFSITKKKRGDLTQKTVAELLKIAQAKFNAWIRKRDQGKPCINCGKFKTNMQAGHFYPTSTYPGLGFDEDNTHSECIYCNYYNSQSHAYGYRKNLMIKLGEEKFKALELRAAMSKRGHHKFDRFTLMEIISKYSNK